jgi:hypothetical protein
MEYKNTREAKTVRKGGKMEENHKDNRKVCVKNSFMGL